MRIVKTSTVVSLLAAASIVAAPGLAFAENSTAVINSGDRVSINSATNQNSSVSVTNSNTAAINQSVNAHANTGGNTADKNISLNGAGASILTGSATVGTVMGVNANNNVTNIDGGTAPVGSNLTDVVNTGDKAHVNTSTNTSNVIKVLNSNNAAVDQSVTGKANTGWNEASSNIGAGTIGTGAAGVGTTMGVDVNHNTTAIGGLSGWDALMNQTSITNTGDHSSVNSSANSNSHVKVTNYNSAYVDQLVHGGANTGYNAANSNIGGGLIGTGAAGVGATLGVNANTNVTGIDTGWWGGELSGNNMHDIVNTGNGLHSNTSVNDDSHIGVSNYQHLYSSQFQWSHTNTGKNETSSNIGGSGIGTSGAAAGAVFGLTGNTNLTGVGGMLGGLLSLIGVL